MIIALALGVAVASPCTPVEIDRWTADLRKADAAFGALDEAGFDDRMQSAGDNIPCLAGLVSPSLAAQYHRLVGLRRYVRRDESGAKAAFAAARAVDPFGAMPSSLLPPGHEARTLADNATTPGATVHVPRPKGGKVWFDGQASQRRPADRPSLVQIEVGSAITSQYLAADEPMPAYEPRPGAARWAVGGAGAALVLGSVVFYGLAADQRSRFLAPVGDSTTREQLLAMQSRNHAFVGASAGSLALGGLAIGVAAFAW